MTDTSTGTDASPLLRIKKLVKQGLVTLGSQHVQVSLLPTGIQALDALLGGGLPAGQITEVYGPYGTGKSTIMYHVLVANAGLKRRSIGVSRPVYAAFVDTEGSYDADRLRALGGEPDDIAKIQPDYGEQAMDFVLDVSKARVKLVIIDSLRGLVPAKILSQSVEDDTVAAQARAFAKFFPRFVLMHRRPALVCTNQVTSRIGVPAWADPYTTPGGHAIKHLAYLRLEVRRRGTMKLKDKPVGQEVVVRITKSKYCAPMRDATLFLMYDRGFVDESAWDAMRSRKGAKVEEEAK